MIKKIRFSAVFLAALTLTQVVPFLNAAEFGSGRAQMIPAGGGEVLLDDPANRVALRFTAERDGPLTSIKFASRIGLLGPEPAPKLFTATLVEDNAGKPGKALAAGEAAATAAGARAREVLFRNTIVKGGRVYQLVISLPDAGATKQMSVNYYLFDGRTPPLNSFDMETPAPGCGVLASMDGGVTWQSESPYAVGSMAIVIGGRLQGWGYTGGYDARLFNTTAGERQFLMQTFKFTTAGKGTAGKVSGIRFQLRAAGGLSMLQLPLRVRLLEGVRLKEVISVPLTVTTEDASRFFPVEVPLKDIVLKEGGDYTLSVDMPRPTGDGAKDFLFIRTLSWGFGDPSLVDVGWQGADGAMIQSPTEDNAGGQTVAKVDIPFVIDYTPVR